jgi:hypothetical protein
MTSVGGGRRGNKMLMENDYNGDQ